MKKIISVFFVLLLLTGCNKVSNNNKQAVDLYFLSSDSSKMIVEKREIDSAKDKLELLASTTKALLEGPVSPELKRAIPADVKLLGISLDEKIVTVNMSEKFESGTDVEKLWSRYTLVSTLCSVYGVEKTKILVEGKDIISFATGEALGALGKDDIIIDSPPAERNVKTITLYFAEKSGTYLEPEKRSVADNKNEKEEYLIVSGIISGPKEEGLVKTVSPDVKIRSVETKEGVCFVNLSQEFVTKNTGGSAREGFAVYSIVNSLCRLETVDKVQFLIEGQKIETFGQFLFNEPFVEDESFYAP
jgi:germination protein M